MKRELLFDSVLAADAEAKEAKVNSPRTWDSVFDIPRGTQVRCGSNGDRLYINSRGLGWWISFTEIEEAERAGWALRPRINGYGPFTEVER